MPCMERGGDLPAQERDENTTAQEEELEALEAIYGEDCEVISRGSTASCPEVNIMIRTAKAGNIYRYGVWYY